ncbi:ABC transporter ATP-binding protein [Dongia deserti]|uniref:ABC transporter ATP-binding protein n=1 Tax=Dongia deserti TaxID=2268030 RepID=UPI000E65BE47|nr:ABC transporter ATP-binding protein [Dongia deserti]
MASSSLKAVNISVEFSGLRALDDVTLTVDPEEIVGLIGPNGSGKTTLVNAITGEVPLVHGSVSLREEAITSLPPWKIALKGISRSFQIVRLFNNLTVIENIESASLAHGDSLRVARGKSERLLDEFGLSNRAEELGGALSYGDKRRVEIARALAADPSFLLLDEPAAGMNEAETDALLHTLSRIPRDRKLGLLIIDHDMSLIMRLCHRLHVLASGRTIAAGKADEIRRDPAVIEAYLGAKAAHA